MNALVRGQNASPENIDRSGGPGRSRDPVTGSLSHGSPVIDWDRSQVEGDTDA